MTLFQLKIFSLAAKMPFHLVAEMLYISPSSVTKYIASLETELGHNLFIRERNQNILTDFGQNFLPYTNQLLSLEQSALAFAGSAEKRNSTIVVNLDIALLEKPLNTFYSDLCQIRQQFLRENPDMRVSYRFLTFMDMKFCLLNNNIDIELAELDGYAIEYLMPPTMEYLELQRQTYALVVPEEHGSDTRTELLEEDIQNVEMLMYVNSHTNRKLVSTLVTKYMQEPLLVPLRHWGELLMKLVSGDGSALVQNQYVDFCRQNGGIVYPLDTSVFSTGIYAVWKKENVSPPLKQMLERMRSILFSSEDSR